MFPTAQVLANYTNLVWDELPGAAAVWHIDDTNFVRMVLVLFFHAAKRGFARFQFFDPRMGRSGCEVLVPLLSGAWRCVDHCGFATFTLGCTLDFASAHLEYHLSAGIDWSSIYDVHFWFPYSFANGCLYDMVDLVLPSRKRDANGLLEANWVYAAVAVLWVVPIAERCSLPSAVT